MRLGIDFGTTRTVVACSDRGNYPVLSFTDDAGNPLDWFPSIVAERQGELRFGLAALEVASEPGWATMRSFKRMLSGPRTAPDREVELGSTRITVLELLTRFLTALREAILTRSNRPTHPSSSGPLQAVVATPANAHGAQRFVTLDAFRRAGFEVMALLNEPSAAGFEYTHRHRSTLTAKREHVVVYDLGGGTFDASLVHMSGRRHDAVATAGLNALGGDDFDAVLVNQALAAVKLRWEQLPLRALAQLTEQAREAKERLNPNSRRIMLDLEGPLGERAPVPEVTLSVSDFYDACLPLVERTIDAMLPVMARLEKEGEDPMAEIAGIYVVGGASALPVVGRRLRERFGRRVYRSPYPSAAVAIGLGLAVDEEAGFELSDRLSRHFGVFREGMHGQEVTFDPIFGREDRIPTRKEGSLSAQRVYRAAHNVGRYRFAESAVLDANGLPHGDMALFKDVVFPFDPALRADGTDLASVQSRRLTGQGPLIREEYRITAHGIIEVSITDMDSGYTRSYTIGA